MEGDSIMIKEKDYIEHVEMTPEERERELEKLKEESKKLKEWPET